MVDYAELYYRDGTNKRRRKLPALDPATAPVDERTIADWLAFLQELAGELKYIDLDNRESGTWVPPFYPDTDSYQQAKSNEKEGCGDPVWWPTNWQKTLENYLNAPEKYPLTEAQYRRISPPHRTLLLVFLQLLQETQGRINDFPRRLLDFYYREYLQFQPKPARADQLHALVELARGVKQVYLPAGSRLDAGMGADKVPLVYATDRDCFFNQAKIESVRSLYRDINGALWAAPDATKVLSAAAAGEQEVAGWKTFGASPDQAPENTVFPARTGLAICSPVLWLEGGDRSIQLTLTFTTSPPDVAKEAFSFFVSTPEGMKRIEVFTSGDIKENKIPFTLPLEASFPPVVPLSSDFAGDLYWESESPLLAILLYAKETSAWGSHYAALQPLEISYIDIQVQVGSFKDETKKAGLPNCLIENDEGVLDPKKAFEPFTNRPKQGRNFYLSHPEMIAKNVDKISIAFSWADVPWGEKSTFEKYYENYKLILGEDKLPANLTTAQLFVAGQKTPVKGSTDLLSPSLEEGNLKAARYPYFSVPKSVVDLDWYLALRLNGDFGNDLYPFLLNKQVREGMSDTELGKTNLTKALNQPYVPKSNGLTVAYSSKITLDFRKTNDVSPLDAIYHLHPYGYQRLSANAPTLLPFYNGAKAGVDAGELYIGLNRLTPPQTLSLLIQMVDGSANPDRTAITISWSYLGPNGWQKLEDTKQIIEDKTMGLLQSGILQLDIPADAVVDNPLLPRGLIWLRAALGAYTDTVADIQALHTQAVRATLLNPENHPLHLQKPLPPNAVKGLLQAPVGIAKIHQPYSSQGGVPVEAEADFFVRCSERLRHKQRALTPWDYEHLVLEAFPEIYTAKCIPATTLDKDGTTVQLIVVPDIRNARAYNPFEPKVSAGRLAAVGQYLQPLLPPLTKVAVRNAAYEPVQVRALIRLKKGYYETGYYQEQTNRAIQRYLCPWAFEEAGDISIGGRLYVSNLIHFVENLPWVDYVKNLYLKNTSPWGQGQLAGMMTPQSYLETSNHENIWSSTTNHFIYVLPPEGAEPPGIGIEYMIVEYDFKVNESNNRQIL